MNDAFFKPSLNVGSFVGENSSVDTERFLLFMQAYYEWMQSTTITLTSKTGTFVVGETIVGETSGATAIVKEVKTNSIIVKLTTRTVFDYSEVVDGQTSSATATVNITKDNVGRATGNVLNYKTLETSVDKYVDYLREELYPSIPSTYYGDKRLVAQYFKDFYESKSNEQSYRFLFKLLYNEDIDFYYPGTDVLRVSDGNFEKTQIIRTIAVATGTDSLGATYDRDIFLFLNKTIRGQSSGFLANVVDIKKFFIGSREVAEMTLKLVSGTFTAGESIVDIDDSNLVTTIYGIVSAVTIIDGGSGYEDGDIITITGDGSVAQAKVSSIKESPISALTVNTIGHGYQLNTFATIDNSGTGGSGFIVKVTELANTYSVTSGANTYTVGEASQVSIINRGEGYFKKPSITLQDTTIASLGLLSDKLITINNAGSNYGVGNTLVFTGGAGANAAGQIASVVESTSFDLLFEDGFQMKADGSYYDIIKNEDWSLVGPIKRIELTNFGTGYSSASLPVITVNTTTGSSANLIATNIQGKSANVSVDTSNNITGIGSIRAVEITNFGINYSTANAYANTVGDGNAILSAVISGLGIKEGVWLDDDGKVDYKIIQDSYYYQDYSYVIKSGLTFQTYSNTLKSIIHPAGLVYFGEINILNNLNVPAELINNEEISRMLVQIFAQIYVGGNYEYSNITWTIKVEAPVLRLDTDLLDVQEYVVHLVPEGDDLTGITDVGVVINQGAARHSFVIQTPFEIGANATFAQSKTTQFVITNQTADILDSKEYVVHLVPEGDDLTGITDVSIAINENSAQNLFVLQIPFDVDVTPTSATLPTTKFVIGHLDTLPGYGYNTYADLPLTPFGVYSENWSNTPISELQNVRFSDSYGENPAYQSIMNLYIDNTLDISVSGVTSKLKYETFAVSGTIPLLESIVTTESLIVKPEIPIQLTLNDVGVSMSTVMDRELPVYVTLSDLDTYQEYVVTVSPSPSVLDVSVVASSILPQKFTSAQNVISLYQLRLADTIIADVTDQTFESIIPQSLYESGNTSFGQTAFDGFIKNYPNSYQQYNKIITPYVVNTESNYAGQSTVVSYTASGFKYRIYAELSLSELASTTIGELSEYNLELYADTVTDITVKASPSPFIDGHASLPAPQDIFRSKYSREINSTANSLITTNNSITVYNKISGTISSGTSSYSNTTISEYGNTSISLVQSKSFGETLNTVLGIDTDLVSDFSSGDTLLANNELFTVEAIANATFMTTTTAPTTAYSGVIAYNIPT